MHCAVCVCVCVVYAVYDVACRNQTNFAVHEFEIKIGQVSIGYILLGSVLYMQTTRTRTHTRSKYMKKLMVVFFFAQVLMRRRRRHHHR